MKNANLDPSKNKWHEIFDFNKKTQSSQIHWTILDPNDEDATWYPLGQCTENCIPRNGPRCQGSKEKEEKQISLPAHEKSCNVISKRWKFLWTLLIAAFAAGGTIALWFGNSDSKSEF